MKFFDLQNSWKVVKNELSEVIESIDESQFNYIVDEIIKTRNNGGKILGYAAGRMGLSLRAFIMRLNHLGIPAYWFGDTYIPPMTELDMFICCSNSGSTKSVANILDIFNNVAGGYSIAVVGKEDSYMASQASNYLVFKTCNGGLNSCDDQTKINSIQPMTSLTEQAMLILFDMMALAIIEKLSLQGVKKFHSNIE